MRGYFYPPAPGTETGPCLEEGPSADSCMHTDCAKMREEAVGLCRHCKKQIGYDNRVYFLEGNELVHARCHDEAEERQAARE